MSYGSILGRFAVISCSGAENVPVYPRRGDIDIFARMSKKLIESFHLFFIFEKNHY